MNLQVVIGIIFIVLLAGIMGYFIYDIYRIRPGEATEQNVNTCSSNSVYLAWVQGVQNPSNCPPYVNKYFVEDRILKERSFKVDDSCCWFADEDPNIVVNPFMCNVMMSGSLTDEQLNEKPYEYQAGSIQYLNPSCIGNDCITLTSSGGSEYVISKYNYRNSKAGVDESVITLDAGCGNLSSYMLNGVEQLTILPNGRATANAGSPPVVRDIVNAYNRTTGFFPVPLVPMT